MKHELNDNSDNLYKDFYKDDIYYTNINIIYVNTANNIEKIKNESFLMTTPNYITREEIIGILKANSIDHDKRYSLLSILKYNITIEPEDIPHYLKKSFNEKTHLDNHLDIIKNIDTIKFEKTISMFQDLTELIIIFFEKYPIKKKEMNNITNNITKKIYLNNRNHTHNNNRKTIKKQFKV